ncbi:BamA/TamA family outer membrane protein [Ruegeria pomeroyi]|uniref:BamA/TamA family outer membrane protein n=1 Tax=Ruegeria pomeroyi TaxID=89184 RepID=A0A9Q3ZMM7_9RHOB|nr:BamA/TamA family outer membrane protein [Ruegeria pomeroyi]MCE8536132.1 BamA/TamA family outer membrane protein [Ruegeria pomeroyi]
MKRPDDRRGKVGLWHPLCALVAGLLLCLWSAPQAAAQAGKSTLETEVGRFTSVEKEELPGFRRGSFVVAPIPFSNPTIGSGLVLGAGYLFTLDPASKPSMIGIGALRSDNGSEGVGLAGNFAFDNNRWQIESLYARANLNYDLHTGIGLLPIHQKGELARVSLSYGFNPQFSAGLSLRYLDTKIDLARTGIPPLPPPFNRFTSMRIVSPGLVASLDTRDDTIYPTQGALIDFEATRGLTLEGVTGDYSRAYLNLAVYHKPWKGAVLAAAASVCGASSDTPFFDLCSLGGTDGFRGYSVTEFLDQRSASLQVELRQRLGTRLGVVAFGGVGTTGRRFSDFSLGTVHSAWGIGARYRLSRKFPLDFSVDLSRNRAGEDLLYIYVGQRF